MCFLMFKSHLWILTFLIKNSVSFAYISVFLILFFSLFEILYNLGIYDLLAFFVGDNFFYGFWVLSHRKIYFSTETV